MITRRQYDRLPREQQEFLEPIRNDRGEVVYRSTTGLAVVSEPPPKISDEEFAKLSPGLKLEYARAHTFAARR